MKTNERAKLESQILEMRKRLMHEVDSAEEALREDGVKSGQGSSLPTHAADADVDGMDSRVAICLNEESLLEQVETAMQKLQSGTRGDCLYYKHRKENLCDHPVFTGY